MGIIKNCKRIVIKIGTSTLTYPSGALNLRRIELLTRAVSDFKNAGHEVVMVSSGAVGAGWVTGAELTSWLHCLVCAARAPLPIETRHHSAVKRREMKQSCDQSP